MNDPSGADPGRAPRRRLAVVSFGAIVLVVAGVHGASRPEWPAYTWHASSAVAGFARSGTLADHGSGGLVHTEQDRGPWVVIDMGEERLLWRVAVANPRDCCGDEGLPLVVEVGTDGSSFHRVGRRLDPFDTWTVQFRPAWARYVRLRSAAFTSLRVRQVRIP